MGIHCKNEEESKKLCEAFDKMKKTWHDGVSYVNLNLWVGRHSQNGICYLNNGFCAEKKWCLDNNLKVYEFENVKFEEEIKMNDDVKKVFEMLGVEPMQNFQLEFKNGHISGNYRLDNELFGYYGDCRYPELLRDILVGEVKIIKSTKKKKLRDWTMEDFKKWEDVNCKGVCDDCPFTNVHCNDNAKRFWMNHKDLFSDKFLDQEVEVE